MNESELLDKIFELVNSESVNELAELFFQTAVLSVINLTNDKEETPLHTAAGKLRPNCIQLLLDHGANPNAQDAAGRTPVLKLLYRLRECSCEFCRRKAARCIQILGEFQADMNIEDGTGETPLHFAGENQWPECVAVLLDNKAIVGMYKKKAMVKILLERTPSIITSVLDHAIEMGSDKIHDPDFEMSFDLGVILPTQTMMSSKDKCVKDFIPAREMEFLHDLVKSGKGNMPTTYARILYHPLVHVFTDIKWKRLQIFYICHLAVQFVFLGSYTLFLFLLTYFDCPYVEKVVAQNSSEMQLLRGSNGIFNKNNSIGGILAILEKGGEINIFFEVKSTCQLSFFTTCIAGFVLFCTVYFAAVEMKQMMLDFKDYVRDVLNYAQLLCIAAALATILVSLDSKSRLYFWVYPVAGFGMTMSWCQIFIQIGRLPIFSIYVDMLVKVTYRFCYALLTYSTILIAFALSYCILFPLEPKLVDIPLALIRVLTMMVGELDYNGLFANENKSPITSHLWYACFVILVTMILMNLMLGMAVSDIQKCRKNAELYVIKRRIWYLWFLEKSFYFGTYFTPWPIRSYLRKAISVLVPSGEHFDFINNKRSEALINGCYRLRPNRSSCTSLSPETKKCIKQWLAKRECLQHKGICKRETGRVEKPKPEKKKPPTDSEFEGVNVQKVRGHSTSPKLSWTSAWQDGDPEHFSRRNTQFNMTRMERKIDALDTKIDLLFRRFELIVQQNE